MTHIEQLADRYAEDIMFWQDEANKGINTRACTRVIDDLHREVRGIDFRVDYRFRDHVLDVIAATRGVKPV